MEALLGYMLNAAWVVPLTMLAALVLSRIVRLDPRAQCWLWIGFLVLALVLPMRLHLALPSFGPGLVAPDVAQVVAIDAAAPIVEPVAAPVNQGLTLAPWQGALLVDALLLSVLIGAARLGLGLLAARTLVRRSIPAVLPAAVEQQVWRFMARRGAEPPTIRTTPGLSTPVVVGLFRPSVLLPEGFTRHGEAEMTAALLHECAHVVRRDYAANLACEVLALPLTWHPALYPLKAGIRAARERACDRLASGDMASPENYARCLVALARDMIAPTPPAGPALALFGRGGLESRVKAVLARPQAGGRLVRAGNVLAVGGGMAMVSTVALLLHVTPSFAAEPLAAPPAPVAGQPAPTVVSKATIVRRARKAAPARRAVRIVMAGGPAEVDLTAPRAADGVAASVRYAAAGHFHRWTASDGQVVGAFTRDEREPTAEEKTRIEAAARAAPTALPLEASGIRYLHQWTGADGRVMLAYTRDTSEPTAEQKTRLEAAQARAFKRISVATPVTVPIFAPRARSVQVLAAEQARTIAALARENPELAERISKAIATLNAPEVREALARARRDETEAPAAKP